MSKARPHAHIYEKWVRGLRKAVPSAEERCALLEYIIAYQIAKVYDAGEIPPVQDLSQAAALALAMLEGDLEELCEERRANNDRRRENGAKAVPSSTEQPLAGTSSPLQSNTIQDNNNTSQSNAKQALESLADGLKGQIKEFDLGLALLRKGYLVKAADLHSVYERAAQKEHPLAYAAKAMVEAADRAALTIAANFIEATGCRDTRALEVYGVGKISDDGTPVLEVRCTAAAREVLSKASKANIATYLETCGADRIEYFCNGQ